MSDEKPIFKGEFGDIRIPFGTLVEPGTIYKCEEPEVFGKFSVRTELTVLPGDLEAKNTGWVVKEYSGGEVFKLNAPEVPLLRKEDLQAGDEVDVPTLLGRCKMIVQEEKNGELSAVSGHLVANLEFDKDDRHCWVSTMAFNTKGLKRLKLPKPDPV